MWRAWQQWLNCSSTSHLAALLLGHSAFRMAVQSSKWCLFLCRATSSYSILCANREGGQDFHSFSSALIAVDDACRLPWWRGECNLIEWHFVASSLPLASVTSHVRARAWSPNKDRTTLRALLFGTFFLENECRKPVLEVWDLAFRHKDV